MKKLPLPEVNDLEILESMRDNPRLSCQPYISQEYDFLRDKYLEYAVHEGNPWSCVGSVISNDLKTKLKYHFKKPYSDLEYIKILRSQGSPDVCPMCGSSKTGTLDHFLPQGNYPEWIIYSKNLIPACDCNSKRGEHVRGDNINKRVLHPYFDDCLNTRIVRAEFNGDFEEPFINIVPALNEAVNEETLIFHIETVVKKSTIVTWMEAKWQSLRRRPRAIISSIPRVEREITMDELEQFILETLDDKDTEHQTPNNWYSMFIYGIYLSEPAKHWLLERYNGIVTGLIDPLN